MLFFFFFSSRRRHTRCSRDWSSDVCSSDLALGRAEVRRAPPCRRGGRGGQRVPRLASARDDADRHPGRLTLAHARRPPRHCPRIRRGAPLNRAETFKTVWTNPIGIRAMLWAKLPLAAFAGLRVRKLDDGGAQVSLPAGWKTQNPFRSTYFAAQAMAAEMSTGAPAAVLVAGSPASVSMLVRRISAVFTQKIVGGSLFTFSDVAGMGAAIERSAGGGEGETYVARSTGRTAEGTLAAEFEITWSF